VAGSDTNFRYFVGTGNMVVGATTESGVGGRLQVAGNMTIDHRAGSANATIVLVGRNAGAAATAGILANQLGGLVYNAASGANLGHDFQLNNVSQARLTTTGNLLLGTTTDDGTNRLQVAGSVAVTGGSIGVKNGFGLIGTDNALGFVATAGQFELRGTTGARLGTITSAGVFGVYNELPTTGVTQLIVRAGAGQSTTNLQTWQNAAGTQVAAVLSTGTISASGFTTASAIFNPSADMSVDAGTGFNVLLRPNNGVERVRVSSTFIRTTNSQLYQFSSDSTSFGTPDTGWSRNAAGVIEVNNGTAGTFRDLYLRGVRPVGSTVANLPTASGNTGMMATVTDATVTTIGTTVAGGGANTVLVWSNGTNWRIYAN
jgi:hypothetical protein